MGSRLERASDGRMTSVGLVSFGDEVEALTPALDPSNRSARARCEDSAAGGGVRI